MSLGDLLDCTIFLGSMSDYEAINKVWGAAFAAFDSPPARAAFGAGPGGIALGATVRPQESFKAHPTICELHAGIIYGVREWEKRAGVNYPQLTWLVTARDDQAEFKCIGVLP